MSVLYDHIEKLARAHGYKNITVFCAKAGVPRATMTELKMNRSKDLSKPTAQKFADLLGVSLEEIYGAEPKGEVDALLQSLRDEDRALLDVARGMTPEQVRKMTEFARTMKGSNE